MHLGDKARDTLSSTGVLRLGLGFCLAADRSGSAPADCRMAVSASAQTQPSIYMMSPRRADNPSFDSCCRSPTARHQDGNDNINICMLQQYARENVQCIHRVRALHS